MTYHAVFSVTGKGKKVSLTKQFAGSRWQCGAFIARIALAGRPTHTYHVILHNERAKQQLARSVGAV